MRRGVRRDPSRKRKFRGRAKGDREPKAVNSYYRVPWIPSVWASLLLREMVRSGTRPGQVLSSGRHNGPTKLSNAKKGIPVRKVSHSNTDSGSSIPSDLENKVETKQGLDGCASLLRDILRNEDSVSLDNKKHILTEASARSERDSSDTAQDQSLEDHYRLYSPIIYQALCEHVQTQMSLLDNLASKNNPNGVPDTPCHTVSGTVTSWATPRSGYGLPTPSPVLSPQRLPCSAVVHSDVQKDSDSRFTSEGKTFSVNSTNVPRNSFNTNAQVPCSLPKTDKSAIPALDLANGNLPSQAVSKEADLIKRFQTCMSLLHSHGKEALSDSQTHHSPSASQPAFLGSNGYHGETTSDGRDLNVRVQEARNTKDAQKTKNVNLTTEKVRTIKYLLAELKALVADQGDSEIERLVKELETSIALLPAISRYTNIQVEIALAMQPLRSENAQLRRQVRILNQQLREQEKTQKTAGSLEYNLLKLFSLQSLNTSLQNQLQESLKSQELLQSKNEELLKVIENQKDENKKLAGLFKDKDQTILENKQQFDIEATRMKIELEEALVNAKSSQFKLETAEKENQILGITLRQRDAEVARLRELTRTLQNSMVKLLADLSADSAHCKPANNLTKSLLNVYEKQLKHDPISTHTSIMSYLSKLETNLISPLSEPLSPVKNDESVVPDRLCEKVLPSRAPPPGNPESMKEVSAPGILSATLRQDSDEESETKTLIEDGCNLDETIYIPFVSSTPKKIEPRSKGLSPEPQVSVAASLISNTELVSEKENKLCAPVVVSSSKKEVENEPEKLSRRAEVEDKQLIKKIKEAIDKIPTPTQESEDQLVCQGASACQSNNLQTKGSNLSDGSFLNSDLMSDWSTSSFSTFTSREEQEFRNGLAALDANIARLQKSLRTDLLEK
ncbi:PREDICTED: coiled-coil domain-containing protein 14 [Elephantulus edwardii]|uniref:coiled-coil domain-containing protein 14 n=1 Tax=Elephantulus edwardii TaxID=28737 RepID=UPI0003F0E79B|nr:PREDICTED: coiled-coil domain-containing protein 14 [Elephantulus edwardii]